MKQYLLFGAIAAGIGVLVTACSGAVTGTAVPVPAESPGAESQAAAVVDLPDLGPASEIIGEPWINSAPLTMAGLRGRVVLVEFWTYG